MPSLMRIPLLVGILGVSGGALSSGPAYLVRDVNTTPPQFNEVRVTGWAKAFSSLFFGVNGPRGAELWRATNPPTSVSLVYSTAVGNSLGGLTEINGRLVFIQDEASTGSELWTTDGTAEGTFLLKDIFPGPGSGIVSELVSFGQEFLFTGDDGVRRLLWKTDGTSEGTSIVADLLPGAAPGSTAYGGTIAGDAYFFFVREPAGFRQFRYFLSCLDLRSGAVVRVREFPGLLPEICGLCSVSGPYPLGAINARLLFVGTDPETGFELWTSDGTPEGTAVIRDILPGPRSSGIFFMTTIRENLFFNADDGEHGAELWKTDGTAEGTEMVRDIFPGFGGSRPGVTGTAVVGQTMYFSARDGRGSELWKSDGTPEGTSLVKDVFPGPGSSIPASFAVSGGRIFFSPLTESPGDRELWVSDGTEAGTVRLFHVGPRVVEAQVRDLIPHGHGVLFLASGVGEPTDLWESDGTPEGTRAVASMDPPSSDATPIGAIGESMLFFARHTAENSYALWRTDGTAFGTFRLTDRPRLPFGVGIPFIEGFGVELSGSYLFSAEDETTGFELWKTDGTPAGTTLIRDILPGPGHSFPYGFTRLGPWVFFAGQHPSLGSELYRTDGTDAGTVIVKDIRPGPEGSAIGSLVEFRGALYFSADDGAHGRELWTSDFTDASTHLVKDIRPGITGSISSVLSVLRDYVLFVACTEESGCELWRSDGSETGTVMVKDVYPGPFGMSADQFVVSGNLLFFLDRLGTAILWRSDGTESGTFPLKELTSQLPVPARPHNLTASNGRLFFTDYDPDHGFELWQTNGTPEGTNPVADLRPGILGSSITGLADVGGILLFAADDGLAGSELWRSDGTARGTWRVQDIAAGPGSSTPSGFKRAGSLVYFSADDGSTGRELWALPFAALTISRPERPEARQVPFRP